MTMLTTTLPVKPGELTLSKTNVGPKEVWIISLLKNQCSRHIFVCAPTIIT